MGCKSLYTAILLGYNYLSMSWSGCRPIVFASCASMPRYVFVRDSRHKKKTYFWWHSFCITRYQSRFVTSPVVLRTNNIDRLQLIDTSSIPTGKVVFSWYAICFLVQKGQFPVTEDTSNVDSPGMIFDKNYAWFNQLTCVEPLTGLAGKRIPASLS